MSDASGPRVLTLCLHECWVPRKPLNQQAGHFFPLTTESPTVQSTCATTRSQIPAVKNLWLATLTPPMADIGGIGQNCLKITYTSDTCRNTARASAAITAPRKPVKKKQEQSGVSSICALQHVKGRSKTTVLASG